MFYKKNNITSFSNEKINFDLQNLLNNYSY